MQVGFKTISVKFPYYALLQIRRGKQDNLGMIFHNTTFKTCVVTHH